MKGFLSIGGNHTQIVFTNWIIIYFNIKQSTHCEIKHSDNLHIIW